MRAGRLGAEEIGTQCYLYLEDLDSWHPIRTAVEHGIIPGLTTNDDKSILFFTIQDISHDSRNTVISMEESRVRLVLKHDIEIF